MQGWDGEVSFPALKAALSLDVGNRPRTHPGRDPPQGRGGHRAEGLCSLHARGPLLPGHILEPGTLQFPDQMVLTVLLGPEKFFSGVRLPRGLTTLPVCATLGPRGGLWGATVWEEWGRVDGRQSGHRSGCEAYQVWGAAGLADTRGEGRLSFLSLLWHCKH